MRIRAYITHKLCEDYSCCQDYYSFDKENHCICLCDGMSQSIFPDYWAQIVSNHFSKHFDLTEDSRIELCAEWRKRVEEYISEEIKAGKNPWRVQSNLEEGYSAGCTICALKTTGKDLWEGKVLGDSCIIIVHKDTKSIEILSSEDKEFDSYPDYVDSHPKNLGRGKLRDFSGEFNINTSVLLVSDPFSEFLQLHSNEVDRFLDQIYALESHEDYISLVQKWRELGMHNDDSSLVIIEFDDTDELVINHYDSLEELSNPLNTVPEDNQLVPFTGNSTDKEDKSNQEGPTVNEGRCDDIIHYLSTNSDKIIADFLDNRNNAPWYRWALSWKDLVHELLKDYNKHLTNLSRNNDANT